MNMKHTIRQRVINQYGLPVVKVETVHGELGSKRFDKNGVEIFEGDIVKDKDGVESLVCYSNGEWLLGKKEFIDVYNLYECSLHEKDELEVIGHADD